MERYIDVFNCQKFQNEILVKVECELGRKLTQSELEVFWKASRMGLVKGCRYGRGDFESCWI